MQLAASFQTQQRDVQIFVTTPEERPLALIGNGIPEHLERSCAEVGVQIHTQFSQIGPTAAKTSCEPDGRAEAFDLALVVPPHVRTPCCAICPAADRWWRHAQFESDEPNLFVVGDAAKTPFPRAAGAATAQGKTAADAILARLGLIEPAVPHAPEPECYIGHGGDVFSKISMRYPNGLPPTAKPEVYLDAPRRQSWAKSLTAAFDTWKRQRR